MPQEPVQNLRLLPLSGILSSLSSGVARILDSTGKALQAISDSLGAGGVVDRVSHSAACGTNDSACGLCDAAYSVTELRDSLAIVVGFCDLIISK
jgi:hypothetical protein